MAKKKTNKNPSLSTLKKILRDMKKTVIVDDDGEFWKMLQRLDQKSIQGVKPKKKSP